MSASRLTGYVRGAGTPRERRSLVSAYLSWHSSMTDVLGRNRRRPKQRRARATRATSASDVGISKPTSARSTSVRSTRT